MVVCYFHNLVNTSLLLEQSLVPRLVGKTPGHFLTRLPLHRVVWSAEHQGLKQEKLYHNNRLQVSGVSLDMKSCTLTVPHMGIWMT